MIHRLIECIPNFSEGRDMQVVGQITDAVASVEGVLLLNVDSGAAANRTVVTFVGEPAQVVEAAFRAVRKASEVIDMRCHHGGHPRIGAADVLPLVPVSGVTMEECVSYARELGRRIGDELGIPVYAYESAAFVPQRRNLAVCRSGEYEGLEAKMAAPGWKPDFGPDEYDDQVARSGAVVCGARDYLVAVNFNLDTTSVPVADAVACDVRQKGRKLREGDPVTGPVVKDEYGRTVWVPGTLKGVKAIGWYIEEYGIAQVSMNITDISVTGIHQAFDEVCRRAHDRGVRVTGTELIGLVPKRVLLDAGRHYLELKGLSVDMPEPQVVDMAVRSMGLDDLSPFDPRKKVIEYILEDMEKDLKHSD